MNRLDAMLDRLPPPYEIGEGAIIHDLLALVDLQLRIFDEEMDRVQRSHWVDHAFDLGDLAKLGALFGVTPAEWEPLGLFRARVKATIAAMLAGSVGRAQLDRVLADIVIGAQATLETRYFDVRSPVPGGPPAFPSDPDGPEPQARFVEFPDRLRRSAELRSRRGLLRPLDTFVITNDGIDATGLQLAITGVQGGRTAMPVVVNRTNGTALGFRGAVPAGAMLVVRLDGEDLDAALDGRDVTERLVTTRAFAPGPGRPEPPLDDPPLPVRLEPGANTIWFLSQARYDDPGLDSAMFGVASEAMHQGRYAANGDGGGAWDGAVFFQEPAAAMDAWWVERTPATFRFEVPAGVVRREAGRRTAPEQDRADLFRLLQDTIERLKAAAVAASVEPRRLAETQRADDRLTVLAPTATTEDASAGQDELVATGARYDTTARDRSRFE